MTIWLGVLSAAPKQPSNATSALLVVLAAVLQGAGALQFSGAGRADPSLARASVRRLLHMAQRADVAEKAAQQAFESGNAAEVRAVLGRISAELSYLQEGFLEAGDDWHEFHRDALKGLGRAQENG
jgi:hypothetical protein